MAQWVSSIDFLSSKKFTHKKDINVLHQKIKRTKDRQKQYIKMDNDYFAFTYSSGIGRGGKVLRIWSEPFKTQEEAQAFIQSYTQETSLQNEGTMLTTPRKIGTLTRSNKEDKTFISSSESIHLSKSKNEYASDGRDTDDVISALKEDSYTQNSPTQFAKASQKSQNTALEKKSIIKEWERYKARGIRAKEFIALINASGEYSMQVSENKLYAWQRVYKNEGLDGLLDERGSNRAQSSKIKELGIEELTNKLILASRGRVNISSLHRMLHIHLDSVGKADLADFLAKRSEAISYCVLERYVKAYLKAHPIVAKLIYRGEDAAVGNFLPALGQSNWAVDSINQIVEIDATSIDAIIDVSEIARELGLEVTDVKAWQKRFVLISLVDTYSGVCSFHISDTENSLGVSRAIAKYITTYGVPKRIKSDNGSAFVSKYIKEVLSRLDIEHIRVRAYAGWCKPYVERNFARLQNHLMEWIKGYIGHSVSQRQAIEFFFSRSQRRLRRGQKSNQTNLHTLKELEQMIDAYAQSFMNNAYLQRLNATPTEAYNAKVSEALRIHEYELIARLAPLEKRVVNKKGIAYGGLWYQNAEAYAHTSVYVALNINNTKELFIYDNNHCFIGIAHNLDGEQMSAEMARGAQKIFHKELKAIKNKMEEAQDEIVSQYPQMLLETAKKMPKTHLPRLKAINDSNLYQAKLLDDVAKKAVGAEILGAHEVLIHTCKSVKEVKQEKKKDLSFEAAVLKKDSRL